MAVFRSNKKMSDQGKVLDFDGKDIRMRNGARILPRGPALFSHFLEGVAATATAGFTATSTGGTVFTSAAGAEGGQMLAVGGAVNGNADELAGFKLNWKPSTMATRKPISMETRVKFTSTSSVGEFVIGWSGTVAPASSLAYAVSATSTLTTSVPSEFAGFVFSSTATSGTAFTTGGNPFSLLTTKADVDTITRSQNEVIHATAVFHTFRVDIDVNGTALFFIDDKYKGMVNTAVTPTVALTPYIGAVARSATAVTTAVDYLFAGADLA